MRRILLGGTAAVALGFGAAHAGGVGEPVMEPALVEAEAASSSSGLLVPALLLLLLAAMAASSSGGGGAIAGGGGAPSDRRIKRDITWVGLTKDCIPIYQYRYVGLSTRFEGVMAQDVATRRPDALLINITGPMGVNYKTLGHPLRVLH